MSNDFHEEVKEKFARMPLVEKELEKQWSESKGESLDQKTGKRIWKYVEQRTSPKTKPIISLKAWHIAATVALLIVAGGLWIHSLKEISQKEKFIEITTLENKLYLLPDSSKVWMQPGSSIRYAENFNTNRTIQLKGNSLFEVHKQEGNTFRVYIDKDFIEVKGTCFLVKQLTSESCKITLFNGNIEFNIKSNGKKINMKPLQELEYNPKNGESNLNRIENVKWDNGRYDFTEINLKHLIYIINQMYDTHITMGENIDKSAAFTGSIRYNESLDDVIDKICFSLNLNYKKEKRNHYILNNY
ncbi:MAG: hypothetical protein PARBA_00834 [Parabacteroides sp.]